MRIRRANPTDVVAIAHIYNQSMKDGVYATCDTTPVLPESRLQWLSDHGDHFPVFVFEGDRRVVGWSALNRFSVRPAYNEIAEVSVYVDESRRNNMIGATLFLHLMCTAERIGFRSLVSLTFEKNTPSLRGLLAAGFRLKACLRQVAWLRERWENVAWLQKDLTSGALEGVPPALRKAWEARLAAAREISESGR